ncbi:MAG: hypothetical protein WHT06_04480 [Desulfobacterales bacterium]
MCQNCASPWGFCGCPQSSDYITRCACSMGIYCAVCGHYPKLKEAGEPGKEAIAAEELLKAVPPDPGHVLKRAAELIQHAEDVLGYEASEIKLTVAWPPAAEVTFKKKKKSGEKKRRK